MEGHVFSNWADTHNCRPELYFEPRNQHELRQVSIVVIVIFYTPGSIDPRG